MVTFECGNKLVKQKTLPVLYYQASIWMERHIWRKMIFRMDSKVHYEGAHPLYITLSQQRLNPIKLA